MTKYTILKGWHNSFFLFRRLLGWYWNRNKFIIFFKLSKECWYPGPDKNHSLNKLTGLSFGIFGIHKNSVRLAWIPKFDQQGKFEIYGYIYDPSIKKHLSKYFFTMDAENIYTCTLHIENDKYIFKINDIIYEMDNITKDSKIQKLCYPYFGGKSKAPQTMRIWVNVHVMK
jgi:hypothetical protein